MDTLSGKSKPEFTRRSDTESICMVCYLTVRVELPDDLEIEERIHASVCSGKPDEP